MNLNSERARLREGCRALMLAWEQAGHQWSDAQHRLLAERFLVPLQQSQRSADAAIETMNEIIHQVERDCG
ncbi:MAG: hypothetical protein QF561_00910 [Phycisphaerales bacterium]|nr:hypothetical protein [Phycisphaerales bacterium]